MIILYNYTTGRFIRKADELVVLPNIADYDIPSNMRAVDTANLDTLDLAYILLENSFAEKEHIAVIPINE